MALSNKFGHMVLSTGNKSEMSVGYATLYGDMCGGYNVLKDVYKTTVFALADWRNRNRPEGALGPAGRVVPQNIIDKPPSAELRPDQTDQDSLPPYDALDDILECLIEDELSVAEIAARGHGVETVERVWRMLDIAEYKRRQAPPGRQAHPPRLRPRPPLPHRQRLPRQGLARHPVLLDRDEGSVRTIAPTPAFARAGGARSVAWPGERAHRRQAGMNPATGCFSAPPPSARGPPRCRRPRSR